MLKILKEIAIDSLLLEQKFLVICNIYIFLRQVMKFSDFKKF